MARNQAVSVADAYERKRIRGNELGAESDSSVELPEPRRATGCSGSLEDANNSPVRLGRPFGGKAGTAPAGSRVRWLRGVINQGPVRYADNPSVDQPSKESA
jgi:hypothetical protein